MPVTPRKPTLPLPLALPLGLIPVTIHSTLLVQVLNRIFSPELVDGELDFLDGKVMLIRVTDARVSYRMTLTNGKLKAADGQRAHDLSIEGTVYDFLLLATRREDPDTLFFNRRLKLGGSTELGLYVKNFLDALELDDRLGPLLKIMDRTTGFIERIA
ncbi:MAG: sterol-binding protein [Gammaproteobacteria bacterium]|nr:sterol-binding protein [Gammaproteobacteria bacterium]